MFAVFGLGLLWTSHARAESPDLPVELEWSAPKQCPSREGVLERVQRVAIVADSDRLRIDVSATITSRDSAFELVIVVREDGVEDARTARSTKCEALADAAAIIIATALNSSRNATPPSAPSPPSLALTTAPMRETTKAPLREPPAAEFRHAAIGIGLAALFDFGTLPRPTSAVEANVALELERYRIGLAGALFRQEQTFDASLATGADFDLYAIGAYGCWTPRLGAIRVGPCGAIDLTQMRVEGYGIRHPGVSRVLYPTVRPGLMAEARMGRFVGLFARVDAAFAIGVPDVIVTTSAGDLVLHQVGVPALRITLGTSFSAP